MRRRISDVCSERETAKGGNEGRFEEECYDMNDNLNVFEEITKERA